MEEDDMDDDSDDDDMVSKEFSQILWAHNYEVQWNDINGRKKSDDFFIICFGLDTVSCFRWY